MNGMMKSKAPMKMSAESDMDMMKKPRFGARAMRPGGMKKGGMAHSDAAMDKKLVRKEIARAEKMEDSGMKKGGMVKKYAKGGGIEMKGRTKGKVV